jgi:hypothetical protein
MRRASLFLFSGLLLLTAGSVRAAATGTDVSSALVSGQGLVRQKQAVPDDPLAGLPTGEDEQNDGHDRGKPAGKGGRMCQVNANAANNREVGDLRATLAFLKRGPKSWACPSQQGRGSELRLRIAVDGNGLVTDVQPAGGDGNVASAIAKKLVGQSITPRPEGPTQGTVVVSFARSKK